MIRYCENCKREFDTETEKCPECNSKFKGKNIKSISKFSKKIYIIIMAVLIGIAVLLTFLVTSNKDEFIPVIAEKTIVDVKIIEESLRSVAELIILTYDYSNVGMFSEQKSLSLFGKEFEIWGTGKSFIITYDGEMKFGIDLSQISITENNNIITVKLPPIQMFSHEIKEDSINLLDEKTGLFSAFSITDYSDFMVEQKNEMEIKILEKDLFTKAQENAEAQVKSFILAIPDINEEYEINFVN